MYAIRSYYESGFSIDKIHSLTKIDKWFLQKLKIIFDLSKEIENYQSFAELPDEVLLKAKRKGFSDFQLARLILNDNFSVITSYSIHYTKLYELNSLVIWAL